MTRSYATAAAFRTALETRLRSIAQERGVQIQGLRLKVAIERMLARLFRDPEPPWLLKGGYALELRFVSAHQNHRIRGAGGGSLVAVSASLRADVGLA